MVQYKYTGVDTTGTITSGTVDSNTITGAADELRVGGLSITSLVVDDNPLMTASSTGEAIPFGLLTRLSVVRSGDIVLVFRQMSSLLASGVPVVASLIILEKQAEKRRLRWMLASMRRDIEAGQPLSEAMQKFPRIFPSMVTSMVRSGEVGGIIEEILEKLADYIERKTEFRNKLISSLAYPTFIFFVVILVVCFMAGFVIPRFLPFLTAQGGTLPWNTKLLANSTIWFKAYAVKGFWGMLAGLTVIGVIYSTKRGQYMLDLFRLKLPVFGKIFKYNSVVRFSTSMSSLLGSGITLVESLQVTRDTLDNAVAVTLVDNIVDDVMGGESMSRSLEKGVIVFPPMVASMISIGEETGNLETSLAMVANIHEKMLQSRLKFLNALVEPLMLFFTAGLVGFTAFSLVSGILAVYGS